MLTARLAHTTTNVTGLSHEFVPDVHFAQSKDNILLGGKPKSM